MPTNREQYRNAAFHVLGLFQIIEFTLKGYLDCSYILIKHKLNDFIPFNFSRNDIDQAPLGRLITHFSKVNNNHELHQQLRNLVGIRDSLAHTDFMPGVLSDTTEEIFGDRILELQRIDEQISSCFESLQKELNILELKITELGLRRDA